MNKKKYLSAIILAGPTASGKSQLAVSLAEKVSGVVINADSMQIYNTLPILTSQPSSEYKNKIPHMLYGSMNYKEECNAAIWRKLAIRAIKKSHSLNKIPIIVGGTGLYLEFLYQGMTKIPKIPLSIRKSTEKLLAKKGAEYLYDKLRQLDPEATNKVSNQDKHRILRMWEIYSYTKKTFSEWQLLKNDKKDFYKYFKILLMPRRDIIRKSCEERFKAMINRGLRDEIYKERNKIKSYGISKAIGYRQMCSYLDGEISLQTAINKSVSLTRQYAKRQTTWFKNRYDPNVKIDSEYDLQKVIKKYKIYLSNVDQILNKG